MIDQVMSIVQSIVLNNYKINPPIFIDYLGVSDYDIWMVERYCEDYNIRRRKFNTRSGRDKTGAYCHLTDSKYSGNEVLYKSCLLYVVPYLSKTEVAVAFHNKKYTSVDDLIWINIYQPLDEKFITKCKKLQLFS